MNRPSARSGLLLASALAGVALASGGLAAHAATSVDERDDLGDPIYVVVDDQAPGTFTTNSACPYTLSVPLIEGINS